ETIEFSVHRLAHGGKSAVDTDDCVRRGYDPLIGCGVCRAVAGQRRAGRSSFAFTAPRQVSGCGVKIDIGAKMIEQDSDVWITQRRLDYGRVERSATDRVDVILRVPVVRRKVQAAGFVMDHSAGHRDGVL